MDTIAASWVNVAERVSFGIRNSEAMVVLLTREGCRSKVVSQEIGLARGLDLLIIPLLADGANFLF